MAIVTDAVAIAGWVVKLQRLVRGGRPFRSPLACLVQVCGVCAW